MSSTDTEAARADRRAQRTKWPGRVFRNGEHPECDSSDLSPEERIIAVWTASRNAWVLSGAALPEVPRSDWPGEVHRPT